MKTFAIYGDAKVSRRKVISLLETLVEQDTGKIYLVIPNDMDSDSMCSVRYAADWLMANEVVFDVAIHPEFEPTEYVQNVCTSAHRVLKVGNPFRESDSNDVLYITWDDEDPECERIFALAERKQVKVFDLSNETDEPQRIVSDGPEEDDEDDYPPFNPMIGGDRDDLDVYLSDLRDKAIQSYTEYLDATLSLAKTKVGKATERPRRSARR